MVKNCMCLYDFLLLFGNKSCNTYFSFDVKTTTLEPYNTKECQKEKCIYIYGKTTADEMTKEFSLIHLYCSFLLFSQKWNLVLIHFSLCLITAIILNVWSPIGFIKWTFWKPCLLQQRASTFHQMYRFLIVKRSD